MEKHCSLPKSVTDTSTKAKYADKIAHEPFLHQQQPAFPVQICCSKLSPRGISIYLSLWFVPRQSAFNSSKVLSWQMCYPFKQKKYQSTHLSLIQISINSIEFKLNLQLKKPQHLPDVDRRYQFSVLADMLLGNCLRGTSQIFSQCVSPNIFCALCESHKIFVYLLCINKNLPKMGKICYIAQILSTKRRN